jgi:hypothetical protein
VTDALGAMVEAMPGERALDLGTPRNLNQPKWDSARISRETSLIIEDKLCQHNAGHTREDPTVCRNKVR